MFFNANRYDYMNQKIINGVYAYETILDLVANSNPYAYNLLVAEGEFDDLEIRKDDKEILAYKGNLTKVIKVYNKAEVEQYILKNFELLQTKISESKGCQKDSYEAVEARFFSKTNYKYWNHENEHIRAIVVLNRNYLNKLSKDKSRAVQHALIDVDKKSLRLRFSPHSDVRKCVLGKHWYVWTYLFCRVRIYREYAKQVITEKTKNSSNMYHYRYYPNILNP